MEHHDVYYSIIQCIILYNVLLLLFVTLYYAGKYYRINILILYIIIVNPS